MTRLIIFAVTGVFVATANSVPAAPIGYHPGDGLLTVRFVDIDNGGGANNTQINNTTEAEAILAAVNAQLAPGATGLINISGQTYNVTANVTATHDRLDFRGTTNRDYAVSQFDYNPLRAGNNIGDDFLVAVSGGISFAPGSYSIHEDSDDGFTLTIPGIGFNNGWDKQSPGIVPGPTGDEIRHEGTTGNADTGAQFTVGPGGLVSTIDGLFFERGGGDFWEVALSQSLTTTFNTTNFPNVITHGVQGIEFNSTSFVAVPEPSTLALAGLSLVGLGFVGWRRRRR